MIPAELAKKIRRIQIYSSKIVNEMLAGEYHSVFRGRGMEFEEVRPYQPGDDIRWIDWNVTARTGGAYIKRYVEERELVLWFLVDLSASGAFGSAGKTKNEVAAEICALLAFSAIKNNDKVGLLLFTDQIELFVPPGKGSSHVLRIIRDLLCFRPVRRRTDLQQALQYVARVAKKKCIIFVVSDFQDSGYGHAMRTLARRHDVIAISMADRRELELPPLDLLVLRDAETGETAIFDPRHHRIRQRFAQAACQHAERLTGEFSAMNVDHIPILADQDYVRELVRFFQTRERRQTGETVR